MVLGRTASGAIKVKTDGTTRAVECACCGGECELCGFTIPKAPPDIADFLKKLRGDDGVAAFTQVSVNYSIFITADGAPASSASGSFVAPWGTPSPAGSCYDSTIIRSMNPTICEYGGPYCGSCSITNFTIQPFGIASINLFMREDGCLYAALFEEFQFEGFMIATGESVLDSFGNPCVEDSTGVIKINGVDYPTHEYRFFESSGISGSLELTFS